MTIKIQNANDAAEAIQKISYCIGIMKETDCSKSDVNIGEVISILENNSKKISEYFGTIKAASLGSEYLD